MTNRIEELKKHLQRIVEDPASVGIFYATQESMDFNGARLLEIRSLLDLSEERLTELEGSMVTDKQVSTRYCDEATDSGHSSSSGLVSHP